MKKNMDNIKERIQKLLALSNSPNEHEAALALQKAQELLERYDLSMEEVFSFTVDNVHEYTAFSGKRIPAWITWLASVIAEVFGIQTYTHCQYRYTVNNKRLLQSDIQFVGFEADIMIAKHCFEYIRRGIESGYQNKRAELKSMGLQRLPRGFKNAYALGYIEAVKEKMAQLARIQQTTQADEHVSNLPVVKQNAIQKYMQNLNLKQAKSRKLTLSHAAYAAGLEDGARTPVSRPVSGAGPVALTS